MSQTHHIVPQKTYLAVFAALIGLTVLTTGVAFIDLGPFNTVAALVIAFTKMLLVILFFMGVRQSGGLIRVTLVAAFFWFALLIALTMSDYRTRSWTPAPDSWSGVPATHP
jgi:cytochrome c oxidase subunit 4